MEISTLSTQPASINKPLRRKNLDIHYSIPKAVGIPKKLALTIGIDVDHRRKNRSLEGLQANVQRLRTFKANLVIFPRRARKTKLWEMVLGCAFITVWRFWVLKDHFGTRNEKELATTTRVQGPVLPILREKPTTELVKVTEEMKSFNAFAKIHLEITNKRYQVKNVLFKDSRFCYVSAFLNLTCCVFLRLGIDDLFIILLRKDTLLAPFNSPEPFPSKQILFVILFTVGKAVDKVGEVVVCGGDGGEEAEDQCSGSEKAITVAEVEHACEGLCKQMESSNRADNTMQGLKKYVDEIDWNMLAVPPSGSVKPLRRRTLKKTDAVSANNHISFTYEQWLMYLYHYPDIWFDYATWHAKRTEGVEAARKYFIDAWISPNCTYRVYVAYAIMAFCMDTDTKYAHNVFEVGLKRFMHEPGYILEYAGFLSRLNNDRNNLLAC
nr:hypothetical protein [Tanacetum cinerariifolium]